MAPISVKPKVILLQVTKLNANEEKVIQETVFARLVLAPQFVSGLIPGKVHCI